jgi:Fe-S-cluster containining protein
MSLCDVCMSPGHCCKRMHITGGIEGRRLSDPMSYERAEHLVLEYKLPFRPLEQTDEGVWTFWCPNLLSTGRCGDYENRPNLCRIYVAGSDGLCVHHWKNPDVEESREPTPAADPQGTAEGVRGQVV